MIDPKKYMKSELHAYLQKEKKNLLNNFFKFWEMGLYDYVESVKLMAKAEDPKPPRGGIFSQFSQERKNYDLRLKQINAARKKRALYGDDQWLKIFASEGNDHCPPTIKMNIPRDEPRSFFNSFYGGFKNIERKIDDINLNLIKSAFFYNLHRNLIKEGYWPRNSKFFTQLEAGSFSRKFYGGVYTPGFEPSCGEQICAEILRFYVSEVYRNTSIPSEVMEFSSETLEMELSNNFTFDLTNLGEMQYNDSGLKYILSCCDGPSYLSENQKYYAKEFRLRFSVEQCGENRFKVKPSDREIRLTVAQDYLRLFSSIQKIEVDYSPEDYTNQLMYELGDPSLSSVRKKDHLLKTQRYLFIPAYVCGRLYVCCIKSDIFSLLFTQGDHSENFSLLPVVGCLEELKERRLFEMDCFFDFVKKHTENAVVNQR